MKQDSKSVVLFLHGFMGCGKDWDAVINHIGSRYQCLSPDLPGHGKNLRRKWPEGFFFADWSREIQNMLRNRGIKSCHMVGYSMGGRLALYFALQNPDMVTTLVLESASPGIEDEKERNDRLMQDRELADRFIKWPWAEILERWYDQPAFAGIKSNPAYKSLYESRLGNDPVQLAAVLAGVSPGLQPSLWERLCELKMPVLALAGERDEKYRRAIVRMPELNPKIKNSIIPGCGHNIHFEHPKAFTAAIMNFLHG